MAKSFLAQVLLDSALMSIPVHEREPRPRSWPGRKAPRFAARVLRTLDTALAAGAAVAATAPLFPVLLIAGRFRKKPSPRRILHIVNGSIEATRGRNGFYYYGSSGILGDLGGYFERVLAVFFLTRKRRVHEVSPRCLLVDFHVDGLGFLESLRLQKLRIVLNELGFLLYVLGLVRREAIGVIQVVDPYVSGLNGLVLSLLTGARLSVLVMADYDLHFPLSGDPAYRCFVHRRLEKLVERLVFLRAELAIADRFFYAAYALRNGARPEVVSTVPASAHPDFYREPPDPREGRQRFGSDEDPILLYVGRLSPEKHVLDLPDVLARLAERGVPVRLAVAGDGPLREELVNRAGALGVGRSLLLLGQLGIDDLRLAYSGADVVLGTHMGFTLLEAALAGRPIVAYDWEWHPEIIQTAETGMLVPFRDAVAMADAAEVLLKDPILASELGARARQLALRNYALGSNMEGLRKAYSSLEG